MVICNAQVGVPYTSSTCNSSCVDVYGCPPDKCPDFTLKRFDTKPPFRVSVSDCDGPLDLSEEGLVLEVNMWAKGKLKTAITEYSVEIALADDIGFYQVKVGDIIIMDHVRQPEQMLVTAIDEVDKVITVDRAYNGTSIMPWKKGSTLKIFRIISAPAEIISRLEDITQEDGTVLEDQLAETLLSYEWNSGNSEFPGCFWLEFKLLKVSGSTIEWYRRFPENSDAFLIRIIDTPTGE